MNVTVRWTLGRAGQPGVPVDVPCTVAAAFEPPPTDLDDHDWRLEGAVDVPPAGFVGRLVCEGLATFTEATLDGHPLLTTRNMFRHVHAALSLAPGPHRLTFVFRSLTAEIAGRRPRPRWRTALVEEQKLRFVRTSLLGRIPSWTPPWPIVGPWRPIRFEPAPTFDVQLEVQLDGDVGRVVVVVAGPSDGWRAFVGPHEAIVRPTDRGATARLEWPGAPRWSPRDPNRVEVRLERHGRAVWSRVIGFRTARFDPDDRGLVLDGPVGFVRGACWVPDLKRPDQDPEPALTLLREAGATMIRVAGPGIWPDQRFFDVCDRLGLAVWLDLPLANLDYPMDDPQFAAELTAEVVERLGALAGHPSVVVVCAGSEIEQQAAMLGLDPATAVPDALVALVAERTAGLGAAFVRSTPTGGPLPFHTRRGVTHYYGVGAYRRPLADVRRAGVRFAAECLGFSNVAGEDATPPLVPHEPAWKAGVPRDRGAGWDFEDVRDHYLRELFGVEPVALRSVDLERYLALSRAVTGAVMRRVFAEWRRPGSGAHGALVWLLRDLVPGAGWGVLDASGRPKPVFHDLARAWAPRTVFLTDEGLDGLDVHVRNERPEDLNGVVTLALWRGAVSVASVSEPVAVPADGACTLHADAMLGRFTDLTGSYRFGPPGHDVVTVRLDDGTDSWDDAFFPGGGSLRSIEDPGLEVTWDPVDATLSLRSATFLQSVSLSCRGGVPRDDGFHLVPGSTRRVRVQRTSGAVRIRIRALNWTGSRLVSEG